MYKVRRAMQQERLPPREGGQAALEFALTLVVTLLLLFGMLDFGRAVYAASVVQWAAQHGARFGVDHPGDTAGVQTEVLARMTGLNTSSATVNVSEPGTNLIQVDIAYEFEFVAPIVAQIAGNSITLQGSASMVAH